MIGVINISYWEAFIFRFDRVYMVHRAEFLWDFVVVHGVSLCPLFWLSRYIHAMLASRSSSSGLASSTTVPFLKKRLSLHLNCTVQVLVQEDSMACSTGSSRK